MPRAQPKVLAHQPIGKNLVVGVSLEPSPQGTSSDDAVRRALRSPAMADVFLALAQGVSEPSALVRSLGRSKHAVSQHLAALRDARLIRQIARVGADQRRRAYEPAWATFAEIFAHDHACELELYEGALCGEALDGAEASMGAGQLRISGGGRLLLVRELETPSSAPLAAARAAAVNRIRGLLREFPRIFEAYVAHRRHATLRDQLRGCYEESIRYADRLPVDSETGGFMRFQKDAFSRVSAIETLYELALRQPEPEVDDTLWSGHAGLHAFLEAGQEDADGNYVLKRSAVQLVRPGTPLRVYDSYTHEPKGRELASE